MSTVGRLLIVSHADHGEKIRIINARVITQRERENTGKKKTEKRGS